MTNLIVYTDGGCSAENKPDKPAYISYVGFIDNKDVISGSSFIAGTNNKAEYMAIKSAALDISLLFNCLPKFEHILFKSDSKLLVNQINDKWKCKDPLLKEIRSHFYNTMKYLGQKGTSYSVEHIYREDNKLADLLCNLVKKKIYKDIPLQPLSEFKTKHNLTRYKALKGF